VVVIASVVVVACVVATVVSVVVPPQPLKATMLRTAIRRSSLKERLLRDISLSPFGMCTHK